MLEEAYGAIIYPSFTSLSERFRVKKNKNNPAEGISLTILQYFKPFKCREAGLGHSAIWWKSLIFLFIMKFNINLGILAELWFGK